MRKLVVFNQVTLDGYFTGPNGDLSWAHNAQEDAEWKAFVEENAKSGGTLLFGRVTYQMMVSYWPTPAARENDPIVAKAMNELPKVVFSRTLSEAPWNNTKLVKSDPAAEVRKMKNESGDAMIILGSGKIVSQLTQERLIDEYQVVVNPLVLGKGRTMFEGVDEQLRLKLADTRTFRNGNVLLRYELV